MKPEELENTQNFASLQPEEPERHLILPKFSNQPLSESKIPIATPINPVGNISVPKTISNQKFREPKSSAYTNQILEKKENLPTENSYAHGESLTADGGDRSQFQSVDSSAEALHG